MSIVKGIAITLLMVMAATAVGYILEWDRHAILFGLWFGLSCSYWTDRVERL